MGRNDHGLGGAKWLGCRDQTSWHQICGITTLSKPVMGRNTLLPYLQVGTEIPTVESHASTVKQLESWCSVKWLKYLLHKLQVGVVIEKAAKIDNTWLLSLQIWKIPRENYLWEETYIETILPVRTVLPVTAEDTESRQFTDKTVHRHAFWRQFTDRIEDSSPTELKTVHRQILYCIYMECHSFHHLLML